MFPTTSQALVEMTWHGEQRRFALALSDGFIYFWEPDSPQFQSAPQEWIFAVEGAISLPRYATLNPDFLVSVFKASLEERRLGRLLCCPQSSDPYCFVFLHPSGTGFIFRHQRSARSTYFRFDGGQELFSLPASYWNQSLQKWATKKKPESDLAFALSWCKHNREEAAKLLTQLGRGDWNELALVAWWILTLESDNYSLQSDEADSFSVSVTIACSGGVFSCFVSAMYEQLKTRRERLWDEWLRFFSPTLKYDIVERYTAAGQAVDEGFYWSYHCQYERLSQHERLENLLRLRDWLRERAGLASGEIAELLA